MTSSQITPTQTTLTQTVTIHDIRRADAAIRPAVLETPLLTSDRLNATLPFDLYLKAESLQRTGSFKFRGACNAVFGLEDPEQAVIAFSSGNHAQAVALAAKLASRKATIIMPKDAPTAKIEGTKSYGATVVLYDRYTESREDIGAHYAQQTGANLIKPYDDVRVIAGQGTAGCEIVRQSDILSLTPNTFISCCGGGGLTAGTAIALSESFPDIAIYSAEPDQFDDTARSLAVGTRLSNQPDARSLCDAIVTPMPGEITFPINQRFLAGGLSVSDEDALQAMHVAAAYLKVILEPGGAVALAAALAEEFISKQAGATGRQTIIVIGSGGNCDDTMMARALSTPLPSYLST